MKDGMQAAVEGEGRLVTPLLAWLEDQRRINGNTLVIPEFAWLGRRVDLATLTTTRRTAAYELKLGSFGRAFEQAFYNHAAFDRSYVVLGGMPRQANIEEAAEHGIGIIVIDLHGNVRLVVECPLAAALPDLRTRLLAQLRSAAVRSYV